MNALPLPFFKQKVIKNIKCTNQNLEDKTCYKCSKHQYFKAFIKLKNYCANR